MIRTKSLGGSQRMGYIRQPQLMGLCSSEPRSRSVQRLFGRRLRHPGYVSSSGWCCTKGVGLRTGVGGMDFRTRTLTSCVTRSQRLLTILFWAARSPEKCGIVVFAGCIYKALCFSLMTLQLDSGSLRESRYASCFSQRLTRCSSWLVGCYGRSAMLALQ